jgi:hypothetical protein
MVTYLNSLLGALTAIVLFTAFDRGYYIQIVDPYVHTCGPDGCFGPTRPIPRATPRQRYSPLPPGEGYSLDLGQPSSSCPNRDMTEGWLLEDKLQHCI